ncbi:type II CRISPR RNA-guided endonuclease Cas9 [Lentilactobacillus sp. SPB1-3]|uniref:Type II CRISPR RNA-guided endonuclease Cas9 n=1 Tax=Lentilactobacillus terminaliae TaxID=3003483 RepID=A0ACD5DG20_9LACO|nr:type II CRISPR RNA-guided endonuclease Cas9 [Lentilactobacillus sp. SPB1-3]MCZ0976632.1 type II CRISPR RNA-guided endonuclease Cas9 [Lentilactobacillus sp. SPB1-3]
MTEPYTLGLDIGTNSVGFAAIDSHYQLIRAKGKNVIGVRLFEEGKTAEERRGFRTTRRRLNRRKWRLNFLNEIFAPHLAEIDETFLRRLKYSNLSNQDTNKAFSGSLLFPDKTDAEYYKNYKTIYHLRHKLMTEDRQFDLREVYLAIHHIVKYRGNFLNNTPVNQFSVGKMELDDQFDQLNEAFKNLEIDFEINTEDTNSFKDELIDNEIRKLDRQKSLKDKLAIAVSDKQIQKNNKKIASEIVKAFLGYKFKLDVILQHDTEEAKDWQLNFDDEEINDNLANLSGMMNNDELTIVEIIQNVCSQVTLATIVPEGMSLSESMIDKYYRHGKDLDKLKKLMGYLPEQQATELRSAYAKYVGSIDNVKVISRDKFYSEVQNIVDDSALAKEILEEIELDKFMPKQRTSANGSIPHQMHQIELDKIIEMQGKYYPFLLELNPNEQRQKVAKYKLDELVTFRVPYYVGPMITAEDQEKSSGKSFAWMKRKAGGDITPWNFDEKVDRMESANQFIRRMTTNDTYLFAEDVLPDESILYQKFKVLNELNMVRVDGHRLSISEKQAIFDNLFKQQKGVSVKQLQNFLISYKQYLKAPKIEGLSDPIKFNNSLGTYNELRKTFPDNIDNPDYQHDFENIIEWSTVFEDRKIYEAKLAEITWLTSSQVKSLVSLRHRGWGRLSAKLLTGVRNANGESIMDLLWNTNNNFMQIMADSEIAEQVHQMNLNFVRPDNLETILDDAYTSPQNKKAIRQVVRIVEDIVKAVGQEPAKIAIEFTRSDDERPVRTKSRYSQMLDTFESTAKDIVDEGLKDELINFADQKKMSDKYVLYFSQLGRDMYTGVPINIDDLNNYDIDHVLPQAFIKDDSLNNRVLVKKAVNNAKSDSVPYVRFSQKMGVFWRQLADAGLISKRKLKNLFTDPDSIDKYTAHGFINRQLVETSQVIKLSANILGNMYQEKGTEIIEIRAKQNTEFRKQFNLIKVREVNDYHHAMDGYLTALLGSYMYERYPKLRPAFVYGDFNKLPETNGKWSFDFIGPLADTDKITNSEGEILWDKEQNLKILNDIYNYKFMLVSKEVHANKGALFNQTVYSKSTVENKRLIPIKQSKPIELYGGYSGNNDAYMALVKSKGKFKIVGVPVRAVSLLNEAKKVSEQKYIETLTEVLVPQFNKNKKNRKTGEITIVTDKFEIIIPRILYGQLVVDGSDKYTLGSSEYKHNAKQLVLSKKSMEILDKHRDTPANDDQLIRVFDEIIGIVNRHFTLYDTSRSRQLLSDGRDRFVGLPNFNEYIGNKLTSIGKRETLDNILNGLHANAVRKDLKLLGLKTPFGMMQSKGGIVLSENAKIIYQSVSGLFEREVKIKDL